MTDLEAQVSETKTLRALQLVRAWWPSEATFAIRLALTSITAIYLCMLFELDSPEWAGWTTISVTLATRANSLQKSLWRVVGSVCGGVAALGMVAAFAQDTLAFDIALAVWVGLVCFIATTQRGLRTYGFAVMGYTVPIVVLNDVQHPMLVFYTAVDRCSTITIGIACAYASSVLVAPGVRSVARALAGSLESATRSCDAWLRLASANIETRRPPIGEVLSLDTAVFDAFTEQPSLRAGGRAVAGAPIVLLRELAVGMLRGRLPAGTQFDARTLLGNAFAGDVDVPDELATAARDLRALERRDARRAPAKPLALDWDGWQAAKNAARAIVAVSITNAFWYVSNWPPGSGMVTWAALVTLLYATRDDGAELTRHFLVGAVLAAAIGIVARYVALTASFAFPQLALVLFPLLMLAALGYSEKQAAFGGGYAFLLLDMIGPTNVMNYDFAASANAILSTLLGMGMAVISFTYLMPAASEAVRRRRAAWRMARSVRAIGSGHPFQARHAAWLARMCHRLDRVAADPAAVDGGEILLLVGLLLLALRDDDGDCGRKLAHALWYDTARGDAAVGHLREAAASALQGARIDAILALLRTDALADWPAGPSRLRA